MQSDSKILQLAETLDRIGASLESRGEGHWARWLCSDAARLRRNDLSGITHFLGAFGGMGSINDLYICVKKKHNIAESEVGAFNRELSHEISDAFSRATALKRHYEL